MTEQLPIVINSKNIYVPNSKSNSLVGRGLATIQRRNQSLTSEQSEMLLPILMRIMDAAFRMGYITFKENAKFVICEIRDKYGEKADLITIEHLQNAYLSLEHSFTPKSEIITFDSVKQLFLEELPAQSIESPQNQTSNDLEYELMKARITLAGYHIEKGAKNYSDFTQAMINDLGESIRPYLRMLYEGIQHYPDFDNVGMDDAETIDQSR